MFENGRGPITEHVLMYVSGKMPGSFFDIRGITAHKLVYHTHTERIQNLKDSKILKN